MDNVRLVKLEVARFLELVLGGVFDGFWFLEVVRVGFWVVSVDVRVLGDGWRIAFCRRHWGGIWCFQSRKFRLWGRAVPSVPLRPAEGGEQQEKQHRDR